MKKIITYLTKESDGLTKYWWHRLIGIIFKTSIIVLFVIMVIYLKDSYAGIAHKWVFVEPLNNRLEKNLKPTSIHNFYSETEVISDYYKIKKMERDNNSTNILKKEKMFVSNIAFTENIQTFCSNNIKDEINTIIQNNKIEHITKGEPNDRFEEALRMSFVLKDKKQKDIVTEIQNNNTLFKNEFFNKKKIYCVYILDQYYAEKDISVKSIEPLETEEFGVFRYKNNLIEFILISIFCLFLIIAYTVIFVIIYNKIILYIIYGPKK